ncbi:Fc.00g059080.m01.CDS01 [Cosmosporella sp. VM-42]
MKPIQLDGRTGEGGGQLIRVAIGLAALTTQPVTIKHVRGNREGPRGGGLKSQHVTSIKWLAEATDADVEGLSVGSHTLTFIPRRPPTELLQRNIKISADSGAASTLLILQAIFPFLLFAGNESNEPVEVEISGGTNVHWSLSFEYLDQVLLPTLEERFGTRVERRLNRRGWSLGPTSRGNIWIKLRPLGLRERLRFKATAATPKEPESNDIKSVDVSLVVPSHAHEKLQASLAKDIGDLFTGADVHFKVVEDSGNDARWYVLLVGHSVSGTRWGNDILSSMPKKIKSRDTFTTQVSRKVCRGLFDEVSLGGQVDGHLQDQLVCFQALCDGYSSFPRGYSAGDSSEGVLVDAMGNLDVGGSRMRKEKNHEPFGHGSLHARTARWVVSELLPTTEFYNKGNLVKGAGISLYAA